LRCLIAVFVYYAVLHARDNDPFNDVTASTGVPINSPLIYDPRKRHEAWRFLTYMFIHNGYVHLAFNCLLQLVLGTLLELVHKFWRCGLVYLLGVIRSFVQILQLPHWIAHFLLQGKLFMFIYIQLKQREKRSTE
uniref:Rhomboid domain-containing protein n=1 Tax=Echinostoma caproni TaxID=27848 RepID=A0A183BF70_9TREM